MGSPAKPGASFAQFQHCCAKQHSLLARKWVWVRRHESLAEDWEELLDSERDVVVPNRGQSSWGPSQEVLHTGHLESEGSAPFSHWPLAPGDDRIFLVSFYYSRAHVSVRAYVCVCMWRGGERLGHQDKDLSALPLCSALCKWHPNTYIWVVTQA